jgi:hypothetical protein
MIGNAGFVNLWVIQCFGAKTDMPRKPQYHTCPPLAKEFPEGGLALPADFA